jgi:hypothetical protein
VSKSLYNIYVMHVVMMDLFELLWQLTIEYIFLWHFILPYSLATIFDFISFIIIKMFWICFWLYWMIWLIFQFRVAQVIVFMHFEMCHIQCEFANRINVQDLLFTLTHNDNFAKLSYSYLYPVWYFFEAYWPLLGEILFEFVCFLLFGWYIKLIYPPNIG